MRQSEAQVLLGENTMARRERLAPIFTSLPNSHQRHGDLFNIRPKSPPLYDLSVAFSGLQINSLDTGGVHIQHGNYVKGSHDLRSENYSCKVLGSSYTQDSPIFSSPLAAESKGLSSSVKGQQSAKRGSLHVYISGLHRHQLWKLMF